MKRHIEEGRKSLSIISFNETKRIRTRHEDTKDIARVSIALRDIIVLLSGVAERRLERPYGIYDEELSELVQMAKDMVARRMDELRKHGNVNDYELD